MKTYRGGYQITKALGYPPMDYVKITTFLNLINVPMAVNEKGVNTYVLTEKQVRFLKNKLKELKGGLNV